MISGKRIQKIVFIAFAICSVFISCSNQKNEMKPERRDLIQAVYASGKLYPINHYVVFAKFPGYVKSINVKAGQRIHYGDLLLTIRNEISDLNTDNAKNQLQLAQENASENGALLTSLRQDVASAESKYRLDSINAVRSSELMKQNATSKQAYDQAMTQFDISRQNMIKARENYNSNKLRLKIELQNAGNLLQAQISNQRDYAILSVLDGKVYDVTPSIGDLVNPQTALMEIGDSSNFETELSVDETDVGLITPGQNISYTIDAFPDAVFHGKVNEIFPHINSSSKTSRIKATFESDGSKAFFSGMSVEANIVIAEKKNVLAVKREFVTKDKTVLIKGQEKPVKVNLGAEDLEYVEILSGIKEEDVLTK